MAKMVVPNLHSLRHKFMCWVALPRGMSPETFLLKLQLTNCFPSLKIHSFAWGTFRVQGPGETVCDLCSLPFGWKLSRAIYQEAVGHSVMDCLNYMPLPVANFDGK